MDTVEAKNAFFETHHLQSIWTGIYRKELFNNEEIRFRHFVKYEDNYFSGIIQYAIDSYYLTQKAFYHYRIHELSNSHDRNNVNHFIRLEVELEKLKYYQIHGMYDLYYKNIRKVFLENFYVNTIHIMFCKFDEIDIDRIIMMQQIVRELFPDYLEYYKESGRFESMILTVPFDFPISEWEKIKDAYLDWLKNSKQDAIVELVCSMKQILKV